MSKTVSFMTTPTGLVACTCDIYYNIASPKISDTNTSWMMHEAEQRIKKGKNKREGGKQEMEQKHRERLVGIRMKRRGRRR